MRCRATPVGAFPGSSMVEQSAVNRWVVGSNPAQGAIPHPATSEVRRDQPLYAIAAVQGVVTTNLRIDGDR